jgi:hypothetical protein
MFIADGAACRSDSCSAHDNGPEQLKKPRISAGPWR